MKVFTVGLDEKEKAQKADVEKADPPKVALSSTPAMPIPAQIVVPRAPPHKRWGCGGCGVLTWIVAAFFIVLLCLTISEITYNRQRDQAFLRLKWAELRQRMLGFELLSQAQQQMPQMPQSQQQIQQPVNELPAFRRHDKVVEEEATTTTTSTTVAPKEETPEETEEESPRFDLLHMLLNKMHEHVEQMGMNPGEMQVHVIEVKPVPVNQMPQQSIDDAFGEIAMPRPFGPWRNPDDYNEFGYRNEPAMPWQFDRESVRPSPWMKPIERFNRWDMPQFVHDNEVFGPTFDTPEGEPQMRITHHFEKNSQTPQRVVTEVFGDHPEVIGHILGQKNAEAQLQLQLQQQQIQQQQLQQQQQQEFLMQQQQPQLPQWPHPWMHPMPFHQGPPPHPWMMPQPQPQPQPQPHFWEPRPEQSLPSQPMPQQPVVLFVNQPPMQPMPQPQPQLQQQGPAPPPPPPPHFQPTIGQQNEFPFPAQQQFEVPIFPQPFVPDVNNNINHVNTFNDNVHPKPWYVSGDDQRWQQTWENTPIKIEFNPNPAAAAPWVENTAAVEHPALPQPVTPEQPHIGHDSEGIDGFPREEKFNVPVDISADAEPKTVENDIAPDTAEAEHHEAPAANPAWQHAQPEAAEEPLPASVPVVSDPNVGPAEDKDFLPLRDSGEVMEHLDDQPDVMEHHMDDTPKDVNVAQDDFPKKMHSPFFQVDDPQSINNFRH